MDINLGREHFTEKIFVDKYDNKISMCSSVTNDIDCMCAL